MSDISTLRFGLILICIFAVAFAIPFIISWLQSRHEGISKYPRTRFYDTPRKSLKRPWWARLPLLGRLWRWWAKRVLRG